MPVRPALIALLLGCGCFAAREDATGTDAAPTVDASRCPAGELCDLPAFDDLTLVAHPGGIDDCTHDVVDGRVTVSAVCASSSTWCGVKTPARPLGSEPVSVVLDVLPTPAMAYVEVSSGDSNFYTFDVNADPSAARPSFRVRGTRPPSSC